MIDWHSHILPGMDDGSRDAAEGLALLQMQKAQGIDTVIATPHFYANDETVSSFLHRRSVAYECLRSKTADHLPKILLGAEVRYYQGISRMDDLTDLRIENSRLLLIEMPMSNWTESMVRELVEMSGKSSVQLILAHVERYLSYQKHDIWERLLDNGILFQSNASFFSSFMSRRKALSMLREGSVQLIGSDCHNLTSRPPLIGKAFEIICKKFGEDYLQQMNEYGCSLLAANNNEEYFERIELK